MAPINRKIQFYTSFSHQLIVSHCECSCGAISIHFPCEWNVRKKKLNEVAIVCSRMLLLYNCIFCLWGGYGGRFRSLREKMHNIWIVNWIILPWRYPDYDMLQKCVEALGILPGWLEPWPNQDRVHDYTRLLESNSWLTRAYNHYFTATPQIRFVRLRVDLEKNAAIEFLGLPTLRAVAFNVWVIEREKHLKNLTLHRNEINIVWVCLLPANVNCDRFIVSTVGSCFGDSFLTFFFYCPVSFNFDSTLAVHLPKFGSPAIADGDSE